MIKLLALVDEYKEFDMKIHDLVETKQYQEIFCSAIMNYLKSPNSRNFLLPSHYWDKMIPLFKSIISQVPSKKLSRDETFGLYCYFTRVSLENIIEEISEGYRFMLLWDLQKALFGGLINGQRRFKRLGYS